MVGKLEDGIYVLYLEATDHDFIVFYPPTESTAVVVAFDQLSPKEAKRDFFKYPNPHFTNDSSDIMTKALYDASDIINEIKRSYEIIISDQNTEAPSDGQYEVKATGKTTSSVNIRKEADANSEKVGSADAGETLQITEPYYTKKWHQILYDNQICYVSANYVKIGE